MTKRQLAYKTTVFAVKHPRARRAGMRAARPALKVSWKVAKPIARRRVRKRVEPVSEAVRGLGEVVGGAALAAGEVIGAAGEAVSIASALLATYGPPLAIELGLIEVPSPKRTAPRVAAGVVVGASAVYFLDPEHGGERRQQVAGLVA